jgi:hypothetical protein
VSPNRSVSAAEKFSSTWSSEWILFDFFNYLKSFWLMKSQKDLETAAFGASDIGWQSARGADLEKSRSNLQAAVASSQHQD